MLALGGHRPALPGHRAGDATHAALRHAQDRTEDLEPRSPRRCARRSASTRTPRFSSRPPPTTPPCHRSRRCARRDGAPTAPPPPSGHARSNAPAAHRPPAPPEPCPNPGRATGVAPPPGHRRAPCAGSGHSAPTHRCVAAPAPPPARRRRRPRRTRCLRSPCAGRHPAAHEIASQCARRCPLLWFLIFDKLETLSDNDVRLLRATPHPPNRQKSPK